MYQLCVDGWFAAAHFIEDYHGKCENLHGHNYHVKLYVRGKELGRGGMLYDFGLLKKALKQVLGTLDHSVINEHPHFEKREPSTEYIAEYIFSEVGKRIEIPVYQVSVSETPHNTATYMADRSSVLTNHCV